MRNLGALLLLIGLIAPGCSSTGPLLPPSSLKEETIPPEFRSKLETTEVDTKSVVPVPAPSPVVEPAKKGKKKKKEKAAVAVAAGPFAYPSRARKPSPIWVGEKQTLEVTYLGVPAGDFVSEVLPMRKVGDRIAYHIRGTVKSSAFLNMLYHLDDSIESFWDADGLFSHQFVMIQREKKMNRDVLELYNSETEKVFLKQHRFHPDGNETETNETFPMKAFSQDSFSAMYYARTLPLVEGEKYMFPVVSEGKGWECQINVIGHEMMDTPIGRVNTIILQPKTYYNGVMRQQNGRNLIWVTDDDRRFVVRLEAKVKIGTVAAKWKEVELGTKPE